jgi:hypothetical protein
VSGDGASCGVVRMNEEGEGFRVDGTFVYGIIYREPRAAGTADWGARP